MSRFSCCALLSGWAFGFAFSLAGCGGETVARPPPPPPVAAPVQTVAPPPDPLGPRPDLGSPAPYTPPTPVQYKRDNGLTVWLLERHSLPLVSMNLVVPAGSAQDPDDKGGLANITAKMLDEGAGKRGAIELSREVDRLGAVLQTGAFSDYGFVQLTVLKKNLEPASSVFADVVTKPQLSAVEWKRVHDLWVNDLKQRQSEPAAVASVAVARNVYPAAHPYAHPTDGTLPSAAKVTLDDVKKFYGTRWRADRSTLVVVGDVTRADVDAMLDKTFAGWKPPAAAPIADSPKGSALPPNVTADATAKAARRVIVVDRPDAPQSVIAVSRPGMSAFDDDAAPLVRVNAALGGSFTSRLNQDLREEHGWSYGASSRFGAPRMRGLFVAQAAVHTEHTGDALKAMLMHIDAMAKDGLTDEEVDKTKKIARADLVEAFETVHATATRLGRSAGVGQSADHEAQASKLTASADKAALKKLASTFLDATGATVVIVGPRAKLEPQLKAIGITSIEARGPEGQ